MGVLNLTPDSFSDGGRWTDPGAATDRGLEMLAEGADLLDLGAESTRPGGGVYLDGAVEVPAEEERRRLLPVLKALRQQTDAVLSVDTRKAEVARAAIDAGADLINDISALGDPAMASVVSAAGIPVVLMHSRGELATMQRGIHFRDVVREVRDELEGRIRAALDGGIEPERIWLDPGLGFGKNREQNVALLRGLPVLIELGHPVLVGASRKSFLGELTGRAVDERLPGSLAAVAIAALAGAAAVRVHDISETRDFLTVFRALRSDPT